jgi:transposase
MVPKIPRAVKHRVVILDAELRKPRDIAMALGISLSTVKRTLKRSTDHGDVEGGRKEGGKKGKIDAHMEAVISYLRCISGLTVQVLLKLVLRVPSAYLSEYAIVFEEIFHVELGVSRIHQILTKHNISRKKVSRCTLS